MTPRKSSQSPSKLREAYRPTVVRLKDDSLNEKLISRLSMPKIKVQEVEVVQDESKSTTKNNVNGSEQEQLVSRLSMPRMSHAQRNHDLSEIDDYDDD
jgi:hypothetical protein